MRADPAASLRMAATAGEGAAKQVQAIETLGGSVNGQWALLGRYDLAVVASFPDQEVAAAYCLIANGGGWMTEAHLALLPSGLGVAAGLLASVVRDGDEDVPDAPVPDTEHRSTP
jgi:uncharacterized protein with GYD domain